MYILLYFLLWAVGRNIHKSWGTISEFLCSFFRLCRTLKTELLRLSKHISTSPMTRRRIPKDAAPL